MKMQNSLTTAGQDSRTGISLEPNFARHTIRMVSESRTELPGAAVSLAEYIEEKFIPNHVSSKTSAGRMHYQAILKHILTPETSGKNIRSVGVEEQTENPARLALS